MPFFLCKPLTLVQLWIDQALPSRLSLWPSAVSKHGDVAPLALQHTIPSSMKTCPANLSKLIACLGCALSADQRRMLWQVEHNLPTPAGLLVRQAWGYRPAAVFTFAIVDSTEYVWRGFCVDTILCTLSWYCRSPSFVAKAAK